MKAVIATHLLLIKDDQVLLLLRHNTGYADGLYSVIAGHGGWQRKHYSRRNNS